MVADERGRALAGWGEALRRDRSMRRSARRRLIVTATVAATVTAVLSSIFWPPRTLLLWNASASSPIGLYRVETSDRAEVGDMVVAWPPEAARRLGASRRYLPGNVPLVKRVAAAGGDRVCAAGEAVFVNGRRVALRRHADPIGRLLPWWTGCEDLRTGDLFLLTPDRADAFDGRYFGITRAEDVIGEARLLRRA